MADVVSAEVRSRMMSGIRATNTKPEMILRRGLHTAGLRFTLHNRKLPGKPDLTFPRHRAVLFAHGCFWHGHDCHLFRLPSTRTEFWEAKILRNKTVDLRNEEALRGMGWRLGIVWECALKGRTRLPLDSVLAAGAAWIRSDTPALVIRGNA